MIRALFRLFAPLSIKLKLKLLFLVGAGLLIAPAVLAPSLIYQLNRDALDAETAAMLTTVDRLVSDTAAGQPPSAVAVERIAKSFERPLWLIDSDGKLLVAPSGDSGLGRLQGVGSAAQISSILSSGGLQNLEWIMPGSSSAEPVRAHFKAIAGTDFTLISAYSLDALTDKVNRAIAILVAVSAVTVLIGVFVSHQLAATISKPMERAVQVAEDLTEGVVDHALFPKFSDEGGRMLRALDRMQHDIVQQRIRDRQALAELRRVEQALTSCSTNIMIADKDLNIIYTNRALVKMLRDAEEDLRRELPQFNVDKLIGHSIDLFHRNPAHQRRMLEGLKGDHHALIKIGPRQMSLVVAPVDVDGSERVGYVVEWKDITAEKMVETEVVGLVSAAAAGDFSQRIDTSNKRGFVLGLAQAVNGLIDVSASGFSDIQRVLGAMAAGDLTQSVTKQYAGTLGEIMVSVNACIHEISRVVGEIRTMSEGVSLSAREIAQGNIDLSARTEQQAASIEETASSMEELTSTVRQNANSANQANQLAIGASEVARQGGAVVSSVVTTMSEISASSKRIEDIISVIDGIAFQTNILALNAAVEAARAGEQGRGFAVVASEVRSLAQRSAEAAKEIKGLIQSSVAKVGEGAGQVQLAGRTMEEIVQSVQRVTDIMSEISAASAEQTAGIEQVSRTITQMDQMTQQNAALVEQASAAARSLDEDAGSLLSSVERFKLSQSSSGDAGPQTAFARRASANNSAHASAKSGQAQAKPASAPASAGLRRPSSSNRKTGTTGSAAASESSDSWAEF